MTDSPYLPAVFDRWNAAYVVAGAAVTVVCPLPVTVLFLAFGLLTGELVGAALPMWAIAVPLLACPVLGGLTAGGLRGDGVPAGLAVGGLAGGLGVTGIGLFAGVVLGVVAMGMMPYQGQTVDMSRVLVRMGLYGAGGGAVVGTVLGAAGGAVAALVRGTERDDG